MKKRIGTKLYDTDTAVLLIPEINLYRTQRKQTYFYFDGSEINPVEHSEAEQLLKQHGLDIYLKHKSSKKGQSSICIPAVSADRLSAYCRRHNVTQTEVIKNYIDSLPDD